MNTVYVVCQMVGNNVAGIPMGFVFAEDLTSALAKIHLNLVKMFPSYVISLEHPAWNPIRADFAIVHDDFETAFGVFAVEEL